MKRIVFLAIIIAVVACGGDNGSNAKLVAPAVDSLTPRRGTVGTLVQIHGTSFENGAVRVYFNGLQSPTVDRQGLSIFAVAPEGLTAGTTYDVRIVNPSGGSDTLQAAFQAVPPTVARVNGVTKPTGLIGMTVLIEGDAFGDHRHGKVFFEGSGGVPIQAVIADTANDWTNNYIVTTVPSGTANISEITVQTATGTSATRMCMPSSSRTHAAAAASA